MKVVKNKLIPFKGYKAIAIFEWIFTRIDNLSACDLRHEQIHVLQYRECLYIFFPIIYLFSYLWQLIAKRNLNAAYKNICFEKEAYANQNKPTYLKKRKHYAWLKKDL